MQSINIPIFIAKKIDSDEYIEGKIFNCNDSYYILQSNPLIFRNYENKEIFTGAVCEQIDISTIVKKEFK